MSVSGKEISVDSLSPAERSARMSRVRSRGNRSTEIAALTALRRHGIRGWRRHIRSLPGTPDFYFASSRLALFVHGCFWHGCPKCARRLPVNRQAFWRLKIDMNRKRDRRVRRLLRDRSIATMTVWEHDLRNAGWVQRLASRLSRLASHPR
jgi:DNA mismatch endonuclease (patch repair protein)